MQLLLRYLGSAGNQVIWVSHTAWLTMARRPSCSDSLPIAVVDLDGDSQVVKL